MKKELKPVSKSESERKAKKQQKNKNASANRKSRKKSIATKLVTIFAIMILTSLVANLKNFNAMQRMNREVGEITDAKLNLLQNANEIQNQLESIQKNFYRYLATEKGDNSHPEAKEDYESVKESLTENFQNYIDNMQNAENKEKTQTSFDALMNACEMMDETMGYKDEGLYARLSVKVNMIRLAMHDIEAGIQEIADDSVEEMNTARNKIEEAYRQVSIM